MDAFWVTDFESPLMLLPLLSSLLDTAGLGAQG